MSTEVSSSGTKVIDHAVCAFCGCVCDDLTVTVENGRITGTKHACALGKAWLLGHTEENDQPAALIDGRPASFDKDFVRAWVTERCDPYKDAIPEIPRELVEQTSKVYVQAFEQITGKTFEPDLSEDTVLARIRKNLARGKPLPPGIAKRFDSRLQSQLPHYDGYEWQQVGTDVVLVAIATGIIYEVLQNVLD